MLMERFYSRFVKPALDRAVALIALVVLSPLLLGIAVLVRIRLGGPVLFSQQRPGRFGCPFRLLKFRTMTDARDARGRLLPDEERMTPFGCWLRSTSLDELPELWNILRGEMSFVGPRPLLMEYLLKYSPMQMRRHEVRPGLTGWAQINGRNLTAWDERFRQDVWYVDHVSLVLDAQIFWSTLKEVWSRRGVAAEGHATVVRFDHPAPAGWDQGKAGG
jgi:lipopolysaccharide/colanic/teichoic acid biosynthesis glycosyltransferase